MAHPRHGMSRSPEYKSWEGMVARCERPTHHAFALYGGRGITVSPELRTFEGFLAVLGRRPDGMSLDRIDVNGPYAAGNVRWASPRDQARNRRAPFSNAVYTPLTSARTDQRWSHGRSKTREYKAWASMIQRCEYPSDKDRPCYGGRGIRVSSDVRSFDGFFAILGPCPAGMSLDRIDVNLDYTGSNLRWADARTQARNRRSRRVVEFGGKTQTVVEWAEELNIPHSRLKMRLHAGWPVERALTPTKFAPGPAKR